MKKIPFKKRFCKKKQKKSQLCNSKYIQFPKCFPKLLSGGKIFLKK